jgi:hypothetical protein
VANSSALDHHGSHRNLLWTGDHVRPASIDAIIVPTIRPPAYLADAATLAQALSCPLLTLHSKQWTSAAVAARRMHTSVDLIAIDVPDPRQLNLPATATSRLLTGEFRRLRPSSDLSIKRNLGLALGRLLGWSRVLFLDDDITKLDPDDVRTASGLLDTYDAVGLHVGGFHDHSVVCHAYRDAGGGQHSFIGGGALVAQTSRTPSFFPEIYNDDWFYLLDGGKGIRPAAVTGRVEQYPYDPFRSPDRARAEEFGDVLAEGMYWLLDQGLSISDADREHWTEFLEHRRLFILRVRDMVGADGKLDPAERARRLDALRGSLGRLARITPELCVRYLHAWKADQRSWRRHIEMLSPVMNRATAISMLTRPETQPLDYRIGGRNPGPAIVADPPAHTGRRVPARSLLTASRPAGPQPPDQRQLAQAGAETRWPTGRV